MSLLKRLSATFVARVDESVRQIENHDAVIDAAIRDTRKRLSQAKVRTNRVKADGQSLNNRLQLLQEAEAKWTQRAQQQSSQNEEMALQCLGRRRDCREQIAALEAAIGKHRNVEARLLADVRQLEQRLSDITQQRNLMRSRQSAAEVNRCVQKIERLGGIDIDDTFERWEMQITESEITMGATPDMAPQDDLEQRFLDEEERADLQVELDALTQAQEK